MGPLACVVQLVGLAHNATTNPAQLRNVKYVILEAFRRRRLATPIVDVISRTVGGNVDDTKGVVRTILDDIAHLRSSNQPGGRCCAR